MSTQLVQKSDGAVVRTFGDGELQYGGLNFRPTLNDFLVIAVETAAEDGDIVDARPHLYELIVM